MVTNPEFNTDWGRNTEAKLRYWMDRATKLERELLAARRAARRDRALHLRQAAASVRSFAMISGEYASAVILGLIKEGAP